MSQLTVNKVSGSVLVQWPGYLGYAGHTCLKGGLYIETANGKPVAELETRQGMNIVAASYNEQAGLLVTLWGNGRSIVFYRFVHGKFLEVQEMSGPTCGGSFYRIAVSDDGRLVALGSNQGEIMIKDNRGEILHFSKPFVDFIEELRFAAENPTTLLIRIGHNVHRATLS